ncbi:MAG: hypothetical protein HW383_619 [Candidatus Magasanikbacteria bacterium]|nr:hypothetical protein [Candidatus Magasanikbacteria bacterium]
MKNNIFSALLFHGYRFHESVASGRAITRVHVNVLTPQTLRTMVGVATPNHKKPHRAQVKSSLVRWNFFEEVMIFTATYFLSVSSNNLKFILKLTCLIKLIKLLLSDNDINVPQNISIGKAHIF